MRSALCLLSMAPSAFATTTAPVKAANNNPLPDGVPENCVTWGGEVACDWAAGACCNDACVPGHPNITDCYKTHEHRCMPLNSLQCNIQNADHDIWPFVSIGIGSAMIFCMVGCLTYVTDSLRTTPDGVKTEKTKGWGLSILLLVGLTLIFQITSVGSDRSVAEWEVVEYSQWDGQRDADTDPVSSVLGLGIFRGNEWVQEQIWTESSCKGIMDIAKTMQGFTVMMLVMTGILTIFVAVGTCSDLLGGMGMVGGILCIVNALFAFVLMCCFAAWWHKSTCGRHVMKFSGISCRFCITGWVLSFVLFIVVAVLCFMKDEAIFGLPAEAQPDEGEPIGNEEEGNVGKTDGVDGQMAGKGE